MTWGLMEYEAGAGRSKFAEHLLNRLWLGNDATSTKWAWKIG
jgi:hypothetical protein